MLITHLEPNQVFVFGSNANTNASPNGNISGGGGGENVLLPESLQ